jgi:hypothetical protein
MRVFNIGKTLRGHRHTSKRFDIDFVSTNNGGNNNKHFIFQSLHSRVKFAGVFIFTIFVGLVGTLLRFNDTSTPKLQTAAVGLPSSRSLINVPMLMGASNADNSSATNVATTTTDNSSTDNGGTTSTKVTVNGQPVNIPENGTTQQIINGPNGSTRIYTSTSQNTNSSSDSLTIRQSTLNISTSSTSTTNEDKSSP